MLRAGRRLAAQANHCSDRTYRENTLSGAKDELYAYDGMQRLTSFDRGNLNGTYDGMTGTPGKEYDWNLDPTGNWETLTGKSSVSVPRSAPFYLALE